MGEGEPRGLGARSGGQTAQKEETVLIVPRADVKRLPVDELAETEAKAAEILNGARRDHAEKV